MCLTLCIQRQLRSRLLGMKKDGIFNYTILCYPYRESYLWKTQDLLTLWRRIYGIIGSDPMLPLYVSLISWQPSALNIYVSVLRSIPVPANIDIFIFVWHWYSNFSMVGISYRPAWIERQITFDCYHRENLTEEKWKLPLHF